MQVRKHMEQVTRVVGLLKESVGALCEGQPEETRRLHEQLAAAEHEADELRRDLLAKLSQGILLPPDRQDLVQLVTLLDDVADHAHGASRLLALLHEVPAGFADDLRLFASMLTEAVGVLDQALHALSEGQARDALEACTKVETIEENADRLKSEMLGRLFFAEMHAGTLLLMHDLIEAMENTADHAEDTADLVRVLAVSQTR